MSPQTQSDVTAQGHPLGPQLKELGSVYSYNAHKGDRWFGAFPFAPGNRFFASNNFPVS